MRTNFILSLLVCGTIISCKQKVEESELVKNVIEKESATWRSRDIKGHADCWKIQPYTRILVSTGDSVVLDVPPDAMINPTSQNMGHGGSFVNTNYKMNISGNNAWVSHDEESTAADGKKSYSYEMKILEKINNEWKLVGASIHIYKRN